MNDEEGVLRLQPSGRWAVSRPGRAPVEITNGELFRIEVPGYVNLQLTRMEFRRIPGHVSGGEYYSVDGFHLADGMRAAVGECAAGAQASGDCGRSTLPSLD